MRSTDQIISDLKILISTKGYIYSLCLILFEDFHGDLNKVHEFDYRSTLSVKECSIIIGFLIQKKLDFSIPESPNDVVDLKAKTYVLMKELQISLTTPQAEKFQKMRIYQENGEKIGNTREDRLDFFVRDKGMVEPMYYASDGAYDFQYLDYLESKYKYDKEWLKDTRRFDIDHAKAITTRIKEVRKRKIQNVQLVDVSEIFPEITETESKEFRKQYSSRQIEEIERQRLVATTFYRYFSLFPDPEDTKFSANEKWTTFYENLLDLFIITQDDMGDIDPDAIKSFFDNFSFVPGCNHAYQGFGHFNILNSRPLAQLEDGRYFVGINYLVPEAVYESPYYWMMEDEKYRNKLAKNRGIVGEEIAFDLLSRIFGPNNTFKSVIIKTKKGQPITDIDVFCLLGNKAICVQVKSKKLTMSAKRGDFGYLMRDFAGAVQDAYYQGLVSRKAVIDKSARFYDENGKEIFLSNKIDEVYIMGLTTENYPSLTHQVSMMLVKKEEDPYPFVLSVFDLEILVHYLKDPYDFLYYVRQRINLADYFFADEELVYLGYHIKQKLWRIDRCDWVTLENDFAGIITRNYYPYKLGISHQLSDGDDPISNRWVNPKFDLFIEKIKSIKNPATVDIIFHLFDLSYDDRDKIVEHMESLKDISRRERTMKSMAIASYPHFGLSYIALDCWNISELKHDVLTYAMLRKYRSKCNAWLGVGSFAASDNLVDVFVYSHEAWQFDAALEEEYGETLSKMSEKLH